MPRAASPCSAAASTIETDGRHARRPSADGDGATVDMGAPRFGWDEIPLAYAMDTAAMPVGWEELQRPGRGQCRQSARRLLRRRRRRGRSGAARPADRARPAVPRAGQRQRRLDRGRRDPAARLGARRRPDPGLRHRRLRHRGRGDPPRLVDEPGRGAAARRRADHRLGAGRHDPDERPRHPRLHRRDST